MEPSIGRIVHYRVSAHDVSSPAPSFHAGNSLFEGDVYPAMIVRVFGKYVNLQVFIDANCSLWVTSRVEGDENGQWFWPPRV